MATLSPFSQIVGTSTRITCWVKMCKVTDASDSYLSDDDSVLSSTDHLEDSPDVSENELKSGPETAGQDRVADEETARIKRLRLAVLVLIVIVGTLVAASAFYFLNRSDKGHVQDDVSAVRRVWILVLRKCNL